MLRRLPAGGKVYDGPDASRRRERRPPLRIAWKRVQQCRMYPIAFEELEIVSALLRAGLVQQNLAGVIRITARDWSYTCRRLTDIGLPKVLRVTCNVRST